MANEAKDFGDDVLGIDDSGGLGGTVKEFVEDPLGKIENAVEGTIEGISNAGSWIDDNVLQPALDDPITTIATVAAIATGNAYLVPYINATSTAAKGGSLEDIGKSFVASYAGGQVANYVGPQVSAATQNMGQTASRIITASAAGAARGATSSAVQGKDIGKGAVLGGVTAGVGAGFSELTTPAPTISATDAAASNIDPAVLETLSQEQVLAQTQDTPYYEAAQSNVDPAALESMSAQQVADYKQGLSTASTTAMTPYQAPEVKMTPYEYEQSNIDPEQLEKMSKEEITAQSIYNKRFQEEQSNYDPEQLESGEVTKEQIAGAPADTSGLDWESVGKYYLKQAAGTLGNQLFMRMLNLPNYTTPTFGEEVPPPVPGGSAAGPAVIKELGKEKFELRDFVNDQGGKMTIPFKDDKPQQPIPPGFYEATESNINAAKGGLAVKKRKPVVKSKKGLAVKK